MRHRSQGSRAVVLVLLVSITLGLATSLEAGDAEQAPSAIAQTPDESPTHSTALVLRVYFSDLAERDRLANELGAEETDTSTGYLIVIGDASMQASLRARGLRVEVDQQYTEELRRFRLGDKTDTFYGGYRTVEEMQAFLDAKVSANPTLAQKIDIGDSWCKAHPGACVLPAPYNGYDLWVMRITNRDIPGPKPVLWVDGGIHTREIATPEVAMRFISLLLDGYTTNPDSRWLVDHHEIWVMPMLNPDGHHIVEAGGGGSSPYTHRKNADNDDGCATWPPNDGSQFGVDLNRNFPFMWGCCGGSSGAACSLSYRGPAENSEEETQAMIATVRAIIPDQRGPALTDPAPITTTGYLINIHTNGRVNLYPWGFTTEHAPNRTDLRNLGAHMSAVNAYPSGNGYPYCQNPESGCLYVVDGDEKNWAYGELGIPGWSLELGGTSFFPIYSCLDNPGCGSTRGLWPENMGTLMYTAKVSRMPYLMTRGPDAHTVAANPITVIQGTNAQLSATINYNWTGNVYSQNVAAAEYFVDTPPWAGGTPAALAATDGTFDSPTEAVQALVSTGSLAVGRHLLLVRGRGVNNYEGHQSWGPISAAFLDVVAGGPSPTASPTMPTATPASTGTNTSTPVPPTVTPTYTQTPAGPTPTHTVTSPAGTSTNIATGTPTGTPANKATHTRVACNISFSDVTTSDYFYEPVRYLFCAGAISGYADNTFRPYNNTTRGQLTKIVVLTEGWPIDTTGGPHFQDVPPDNPFYGAIETAYNHGIISGYADGTFRWGNNVTRGQLAKIVVQAEGWPIDTTGGPHFGDVPPTDPFYAFIETAFHREVISGYADGTFRPGNPATRGQIAKIVYSAVTIP